ncbi:MAG: xylose isomerase, partial [Spirochaetales bacterium]|nr:xylose isomerase [Spirochaetales bacterium]
HDFCHELEYCAANGILGSVDANQGDMLLGWDTDEFPTNLYEAAQAMYILLKNGGFTKGGLNFDAHVRRQSIDTDDLFYAHIGGMDAFARGLKTAAAIKEDGALSDFIKQRYASWDTGIGADIEAGKVGLKELKLYMEEKGEIKPNESGRVEMLENIINEYI